jgi:hypothetical protein
VRERQRAFIVVNVERCITSLAIRTGFDTECDGFYICLCLIIRELFDGVRIARYLLVDTDDP